MQRILLLFLFSLICFSACKKKPEDVLANIKKKYKEINEKQKDLKAKQVDDLTNAGGGTITGYYRDEEVKKIIAEHFTDTCRTFTECYFDDGMLILVIEQSFIYNCRASQTEEWAKANNDTVWYDDKKTRLEVNRYYFNENKLIKWLTPSGTEVKEKTAPFIDKESELWAQTIILIKQLKEQ